MLLRNQKWLKVLKPIDRDNLIEKAHRLGHFQEVSTYERLIEQYNWKNMMNHIRKIYKNCLSCQRHQKVPS